MRRLYLPLLASLALVAPLRPAVAQQSPDSDRTVALLQVREPQSYVVMDFASAGKAATSSAAENAVRAVREQDYPELLRDMINGRNIKLGELLLNGLKSALLDRHTEVVYWPDQYPKPAANGRSDDFSGVRVDQRRMLLVWIDAAGVANSALSNLPYVTHYEPWLVVRARLMDAQNKRVLGRADIQVGFKRPFFHLEHVPLDPKYKFGNFKDVQEHADEAVEALVAAAGLAAQQVIADLKIN
jgi:hypothetical protein